MVVVVVGDGLCVCVCVCVCVFFSYRGLWLPQWWLRLLLVE